MPIEVENIVEPAPVAMEEPEAPASVPLEGAVEQPIPEPAPKKRGQPPGSKNKPKPVPEEPAPAPEEPKPKSKPAKKAKIAPPPPPSESGSEASEEDESEPPSPATQRRTQWTQYRQRQVDAHQARVTGYKNILDKMLHFQKNHADARCKCTIRRASRGA